MAYVVAAAWTALISYPLQSASLLLTPLVFAVLLFVAGVMRKRGTMVLYSWVSLAAISLFAQAFQGAGASVLGSVVSVIFFLVVIDLNQFLRRIRPTTKGSEAIGLKAEAEEWSLLRGRSGRTLVFALAAGAVVVSGFALGGPALVSSNPLLATAAVSFLLLVLATLVITGSGRKDELPPG